MGKPAKGTLIRHALLAAPLAVGVLTIPMIETAFRALLVAAVRLVAFLAARFLSATRAAVPLSAITMTAQIENSEARGEAANPLTENSWAGSGHRSPEAELDNRRRSWQDDSHTDLEVLDLGPPNKKPGCSNNRVFSSAFEYVSYQNLPSPKTPAAMILICSF